MFRIEHKQGIQLAGYIFSDMATCRLFIWVGMDLGNGKLFSVVPGIHLSMNRFQCL
jgi:hypothetical protein